MLFIITLIHSITHIIMILFMHIPIKEMHSQIVLIFAIFKFAYSAPHKAFYGGRSIYCR